MVTWHPLFLATAVAPRGDTFTDSTFGGSPFFLFVIFLYFFCIFVCTYLYKYEIVYLWFSQTFRQSGFPLSSRIRAFRQVFPLVF